MQYIVQCRNIDERENFFDYLINNGYKPVDNFKNQNFINNTFPFVIESNNTFWICESITCCAAASACGAIISVDKYFSLVKVHEYQLIPNKKVRIHK